MACFLPIVVKTSFVYLHIREILLSRLVTVPLNTASIIPPSPDPPQVYGEFFLPKSSIQMGFIVVEFSSSQLLKLVALREASVSSAYCWENGFEYNKLAIFEVKLKWVLQTLCSGST